MAYSLLLFPIFFFSHLASFHVVTGFFGSMIVVMAITFHNMYG